MNNNKTVIAREVDGTQHSVQTSELSFRVSVYGVVLRGPNVLLVPQWDGFDVPGGAVKLGEPLLEAVAREVFEETGLKVKPKAQAPLLVQDDLFVHPTTKRPYHTVLLFYLCEDPTGTISDQFLEQDERAYSRKAQWVKRDVVPTLKFYNPINNTLLMKLAENSARDGQNAEPAKSRRVVPKAKSKTKGK